MALFFKKKKLNLKNKCVNVNTTDKACVGILVEIEGNLTLVESLQTVISVYHFNKISLMSGDVAATKPTAPLLVPTESNPAEMRSRRTAVRNRLFHWYYRGLR